MADLKLFTATNDLDVSTNDLQIVTDLERIAQQLRIRYRFFLAEWRFDKNQGVPYFQNILRKNPNTRQVNAILRQVALKVPGVLEVTNVKLDLDGATRNLAVTLSIKARLDSGELVFETFLIEVEL